jgi:ribosomal protein S18 acetylase RimI-like enzyme
VEQGEITRDNFLVVRDGERISGLLVYSASAGAAGQVWLPQVAPGYPAEVMADALLREGLRRLQQGGASFIQAQLREGEGPTACLLRVGFSHVSALATLYHPLYSVRTEDESDPPPVLLRYQTFTEEAGPLFRQILISTYEGTLDFPELNYLRSPEEVLESHRRHGTYHPEQWYLAWEGEKPVGILLLVAMPDWDEWELSYVGVVAEARGRGIGKELVRHAIRQARQLQTSRLLVAVDTRNGPAHLLYARLGFLPVEEQQVYLLIPGEDKSPDRV